MLPLTAKSVGQRNCAVVPAPSASPALAIAGNIAYRRVCCIATARTQGFEYTYVLRLMRSLLAGA